MIETVVCALPAGGRELLSPGLLGHDTAIAIRSHWSGNFGGVGESGGGVGQLGRVGRMLVMSMIASKDGGGSSERRRRLLLGVFVLRCHRTQGAGVAEFEGYDIARVSGSSQVMNIERIGWRCDGKVWWLMYVRA